MQSNISRLTTNNITLTNEHRRSKVSSALDSKPSVEHKSSHALAHDGGFTVDKTITPSQTVIRLKSLARSIRAIQSLGTLKVRNKYIASAPAVTTSESASEEDTSRSSRIIKLSTDEFSIDEMKFQLDHMGTEQPSDVNNIHHIVDSSKSQVANANKSRWLGAVTKVRGHTKHSSSDTSIRSKNSTTKRHGNDGIPNTSHIDDDTISLDISRNIDARIQCAKSLYKLSCEIGNELAIIHGGAIAQMIEYSDVDNLYLQELCAATLVNLVSNHDLLDVFVAHDGMTTLLELSWSPSLRVKIMCATALCRLSQYPLHVARMNKCGATSELLSMMMIPHDQLQQLTISSLVNFIYFGHILPERIFIGESHTIDSQLGIMTVLEQHANVPETMEFAIQVLFNIAIHGPSCTSALRGQGIEILYHLIQYVSKSVENHGIVSSLGLLAQTLESFSSHVEYHLNSFVMKSLLILLYGNRSYGPIIQERLSILAIPCAHAFANYSSNQEICHHHFTPQLLELILELFLLDTTSLNVLPIEKQVYQRYMYHTLYNLSFYSLWISYILQVPHVLKQLVNIIQYPNHVIQDALMIVINLIHHRYDTKSFQMFFKNMDFTLLVESKTISSQVRYLYRILVINLLFDHHVLNGDGIMNVLVDGFQESKMFSQKIINQDDPERFLAALYTIAADVVDSNNIIRLVSVTLDCLQCSSQQGIMRYASAILYILSKSSKERGNLNPSIYSSETEAILITICEYTPMSTDIPIYDGHTQAFCAATLYNLCAVGHYTPRLIQSLITACNTNEASMSFLACAASFAVISFTQQGRQQLVTCPHLAQALNHLGRTSQMECQQYAAIAVCNVAAVKCIWTSTELKDFIVIALLRANSIEATQIHAKTLANLLSHSSTRKQAVKDGVLYALMKLLQVIVSTCPTQEISHPSSIVDSNRSHLPPRIDDTFMLGLQVLFNLSCEPQYHRKLLNKGIMTYLSIIITRKSTGSTIYDHQSSSSLLSFTPEPLSVGSSLNINDESRRYAMGIICNLSSYDGNHRDLIHAQVTDVIRSYVNHDTETRASAAMALRNLSCQQQWVEMLCDRRTLYMLIVFTHCEHPIVKHFAMEALANCSVITDSLHIFDELHTVRAVLALLESLKDAYSSYDSSSLSITTNIQETNMAALQCLYNLSIDEALAKHLIDENTVHRLIPLFDERVLGTDPNACELAARIVSILAGKTRLADALLQQQVVHLCALLHDKHPHQTGIAHECVILLMKLSTVQHIQTQLCETQAIHVLVKICTTSTDPALSTQTRECAAIMIRNLTLCVVEHFTHFEDTSINYQLDENTCLDTTEKHLLHGIKYLQQVILQYDGSVSNSCTDRFLLEACAAIANLSTIKRCRVAMVQMNMITALTHIVEINQRCDSVPRLIQCICSSVLHSLAMEEDTGIKNNPLFIPSLLEILHQTDEELHQVRYECEKVSLWTDLTNVYPSTMYTNTQSPRVRQIYREPKWQVYIVKTIISTAMMVPELEKKHARAIGVPQMADDILLAPSENTNDPCIESNEELMEYIKRKKGYLLSVPYEKVTTYLNDRPSCTIKSTPNPTLVGINPSQRVNNTFSFDELIHSRKFDRHMRLARRSYRRNPNVLPNLS